jgi:hypothetical protein
MNYLLTVIFIITLCTSSNGQLRAIQPILDLQNTYVITGSSDTATFKGFKPIRKRHLRDFHKKLNLEISKSVGFQCDKKSKQLFFHSTHPWKHFKVNPTWVWELAHQVAETFPGREFQESGMYIEKYRRGRYIYYMKIKTSSKGENSSVLIMLSELEMQTLIGINIAPDPTKHISRFSINEPFIPTTLKGNK